MHLDLRVLDPKPVLRIRACQQGDLVTCDGCLGNSAGAVQRNAMRYGRVALVAQFLQDSSSFGNFLPLPVATPAEDDGFQATQVTGPGVPRTCNLLCITLNAEDHPFNWLEDVGVARYPFLRGADILLSEGLLNDPAVKCFGLSTQCERYEVSGGLE